MSKLSPYVATKYDVWALGITTVIGGQYFIWNSGLSAGIGSFFIATIMIGGAYCCLCLCTSEISSTLPFAGGAYGLARCTLGYYPGYLIGCFESLQYIIYVSTSVSFLGSLIAPASSGCQPLIWFCLYGSALWLHISGGRLLWRFNFAIAIISLLLLLIFCFGSLPWVNMTHNIRTAGPDFLFHGGIFSFFRYLPSASSFFLGIQSLNLVSDDVALPKKDIPFGQLSALVTLVLTCLLVLFVCTSLPPASGDDWRQLPHQAVPLNYGYQLLFNLSSDQAMLLSIPAIYSTIFGFMLIYSRVMYSMAESQLLPGLLSRRTNPVNPGAAGTSLTAARCEGSTTASSPADSRASAQASTPFVALTVGALVGFAICSVVFLLPYSKMIFYKLSSLFGFIAYLAQCVGYIQLRTRFQNLPREFHSPVGIFGAVYALITFSLGVLSLLVCQEDRIAIVSCFVVVCAVLSLHYLYFAKSSQKFSAQEQKIMFVAHVINNNIVKKLRMKPKKLRRKSTLNVRTSSRDSSLRQWMSNMSASQRRLDVPMDSSRLGNSNGTGTGNGNGNGSPHSLSSNASMSTAGRDSACVALTPPAASWIKAVPRASNKEGNSLTANGAVSGDGGVSGGSSSSGGGGDVWLRPPDGDCIVVAGAIEGRREGRGQGFFPSNVEVFESEVDSDEDEVSYDFMSERTVRDEDRGEVVELYQQQQQHHHQQHQKQQQQEQQQQQQQVCPVVVRGLIEVGKAFSFSAITRLKSQTFKLSVLQRCSSSTLVDVDDPDTETQSQIHIEAGTGSGTGTGTGTGIGTGIGTEAHRSPNGLHPAVMNMHMVSALLRGINNSNGRKMSAVQEEGLETGCDVV